MSSLLTVLVLGTLLPCADPVRVFAIETGVGGDLFSRDHVWVRFLPQVRAYDTPYTYTKLELAHLISKVSSRFSKIHVPAMSRNSYNLNSSNFNLAMVAEAAAIYNLNLRRKHQPPTEIMMEFPLFSDQIPVVGLSTIKQIADDANSVYPGTVKLLSVALASYQQGSKEEIERELRSIRGQLQNPRNKFKYGLGAFFFAAECFVPQKLKSLEGLLSTVDMVFFAARPQLGENGLPDGVPAAFTKITSVFNTCSQIANRIISSEPPPQLAYSTGWPYVSSMSTAGLGAFWQLVGEWAKGRNSQLILYQAFDTFSDSGSVVWDKVGWWKLGYNEDMKNPKDYHFEEKAFLPCL